MALPKFTMKQLIEAGVHFGHHTRRWNPSMTPYVWGVKDKIHIMDLNKTAPLLYRALAKLEEVASQGGKILFIATKNQAKDIIKDAAERSGQFYVNNRWLGGMMTNWATISQSIRRLKTLEKQVAEADSLGLTKKEVLNMNRQIEKLRDAFGGVLEMHGTPQAVVVIDVPREYNAIREAKVLGLPIIAVCDSNANPELIDYLIPGNDDASRAIQLYCDLAVSAILSGIEKRLGNLDVKKVESDFLDHDETLEKVENEVKEQETKEKSKVSEARAERVEKKAKKTKGE